MPRLKPGSHSSELAGMTPHAFTAASKAKTYLMIRSFLALEPTDLQAATVPLSGNTLAKTEPSAARGCAAETLAEQRGSASSGIPHRGRPANCLVTDLRSACLDLANDIAS